MRECHKSGVAKIFRVRIGIVRFQQKRRSIAPLGHEAIAMPGAAVDGADRDPATRAGQPLSSELQEHLCGSLAAPFVVADVTNPEIIELRCGRPPESALSEHFTVGADFEDVVRHHDRAPKPAPVASVRSTISPRTGIAKLSKPRHDQASTSINALPVMNAVRIAL
jgi:hypothetical protein